MAISEKGYYKSSSGGKEYKAQLIGKVSYPYKVGCLSFYYMLNGNDIRPDNALSVFIKTPSGTYINTAFSKGGHQGNYWKFASVNLKDVPVNSEVRFLPVFFSHHLTPAHGI